MRNSRTLLVKTRPILHIQLFSHPVHVQVVMTLVLHTHRLSQFCFPFGDSLHKGGVTHRHCPGGAAGSPAAASTG